jgi:ABC-type nitrate/sulfonate/bicarbonate transport system substrate-binding protein
MNATTRTKLGTILLCSTVLALGACGSSSSGSGSSAGGSGSKDMTIRLGALETGLNQGILAVALANDDFTKNGLTVKVTPYQSGTIGVDVQDLVSGREDIALDAVIDPVTYDSQAIQSGQSAPLKIIATASPAGAVMVLKKNINFTSVQALKGKKIAVANLTSSYLPLFTNYLAAHGTSMADLGVKLEVVTSANQVPALAAGQIDGFIQSEPTGATAVKDGIGAYAIQQPSDWGSGSNVPITGIFASQKWLSGHKAAATAFVKALQDASATYKSSSPSTLVPLLAKFTKATPDVMQVAYGHFDPTLTPLQAGMDALFKISVPPLVTKGTISSKLTAADVTDTSYGG